MVDINGQRSGPKTTSELTRQGYAFIERMKEKGLSVHMTKGGLEKQTLREAEKIGARLVIIGREQKKKQILNPFSKGVKRKMAKQTRQSLLFIH
jgi:3-keto-L-gulonate-6-phosphate decarboxylase